MIIQDRPVCIVSVKANRLPAPVGERWNSDSVPDNLSAMTLFQDNPDVAAAYDLWAESYDTDPNKTRELAGEVLRRADLGLTGRDILEVGCGTGLNTLWLSERAGSVLGLDISEGMLRKAEARVCSPRVRFLRVDIRDPWPLPDESTDIVLALLVLEHVHHLAPIFREAKRVLRPGGEVYLCELHPMRQMMGRQARFVHPETGQPEKVAAYHHDVSEYVNEAVGAGFAVSHLGEWRDPGADWSVPPRLLSAQFNVSQGSAQNHHDPG